MNNETNTKPFEIDVNSKFQLSAPILTKNDEHYNQNVVNIMIYSYGRFMGTLESVGSWLFLYRPSYIVLEEPITGEFLNDLNTKLIELNAPILERIKQEEMEFESNYFDSEYDDNFMDDGAVINNDGVIF